MKNQYEVEIDGALYRVTIEEISQSEKSQTALVPTPTSTPEPVELASATGREVNSPMAGNIFKVLVQPGQQVKQGEAVIILEAMKMENEIIAPEAGTISEVFVKEGQTVESDDILFSL